MVAIIERINHFGGAFVEFALPMLIQSGVLILILLLVDLMLRKKVRAVFRYWIWILVLVKLVLPTSLSSPVSIGRWFGDELASVDINRAPAPPQVSVTSLPVSVPERKTPPVIDIPQIETVEPTPTIIPAEPTTKQTEPKSSEPTNPPPPPVPAMPLLSWQGAVFLTWLAVLMVMALALLQRALFVRRLVAQSVPADDKITDLLTQCSKQMAVRKPGLKVSVAATSPAVCGLFNPVILVPKKLKPSLTPAELRVVLLHELAHIKRRDLWVNLAQTMLQIFYFYNPMLWLANSIIRRTREQAVDEMVLVAMGDKARQYPQTLVNVAKLAFKRPTLSLRLIGVVESKSALTGRIKHILSRPMPKTAKLGILSLLTIVFIAAILLPMAAFSPGPPDLVIKGVVRDAQTGKPIAGARVFDDGYGPMPSWSEIRPDERSEWGAITNSTGRYSFLTWPEHHSIRVEAPGYSVGRGTLYDSHFTIHKRDEETIDFDLKPEAIENTPLRVDNSENRVSVDIEPLSNQHLGIYRWSIHPPEGYVLDHGWFSLINGEMKEHSGGGRDRSGTKKLNEIILETSIEEGFLVLKMQRIYPGQTAVVTCRTTVPQDSKLISARLSRCRPMTNTEYRSLWEGRFVRNGEAVKTVVYCARIASLDDAAQYFYPEPAGQNPETNFGVPRTKVLIGKPRKTSPRIDKGITGQAEKERVEQLAHNADIDVEYDQVAAAGKGRLVANSGRIVILPDFETPDVNAILDLASGQMLAARGSESDDRYFEKLGRGDLAYEYAKNKAGLICFRGATIQLRTENGIQPLKPDLKRLSFNYYFLDKAPCRYQITTAEGEKYEVKVLSVEKNDNGQVQIEYWKMEEQRPVVHHLFTVYGMVTDQSGHLMEGVQLTADCGHDKLERTGRAVTDKDGRYEVVLTSSIKNVGADPYDVGIQTARIEARAKGYYEVNLCRDGNLAMAGKPPTPQEQRFVIDYAGVVLPHKPYELNFVMHPAAQIEGEYVDERGRPIQVRSVWLHGDGLLKGKTLSGFTGSNGKFTIDNIPCGAVWFRNFDKQFVDSDTLTLSKPGVYRVILRSAKSPTGRATLRIMEFQPPASDLAELTRRPVVDPNGRPVAGAQVALCTKDNGVLVIAGKLSPNRARKGTTTIVETDADGLFDFTDWPDDFNLVVAHEKGFAWVTKEQFTSSPEIRLQSWGRIVGRLYIGRKSEADRRISLVNGINRNAIDQGVRYDYETNTDARGDFAFDKVPPGWLEIGYLTQMGRSSWSHTCRTPIQIKPGEKFRLPLGGTGRPLVGRFVTPPGYGKEVYFGEGLRALDTVRPERPRPENYDQMSRRQQQDWYNRWSKTPEAEEYYDTMWEDPGRRQYVFQIEKDGTFRIDDVIAGKYKFAVWIEEPITSEGPGEEIGSYYGTIEVPEMPGGRSDEPLDLGELELKMREPPLHVGDMAPLFEAKTLSGTDLKLIDYRGKYVLLSFWEPVFHPERERLQALYDAYHPGGRLEIIGLGGGDTLEEVRKYLKEYPVPWPQIYFGREFNAGIAKNYSIPGIPCIFLIDPDGKIIAKNLRSEKLISVVDEALGGRADSKTGNPDPDGLTGRVLDGNDKPVAGAQVALSTDKIGVLVSHGRLKPVGKDVESRIVETDSEGRFDLGIQPEDSFDLIAAHDKGFALVESKDFLDSGEIKLQPWGRVEGRLATNPKEPIEYILLSRLVDLDIGSRRLEYRYVSETNASGHFIFEKVLPDFYAAGYWINGGDTCKTPIEVRSGQTAHVTLGGSGRPVIGKLVLPEGCTKLIDFGHEIQVASMTSVEPKMPLPENYQQWSIDQYRRWLEQWGKTEEYRKYLKDHIEKNWRHYTLSINEDGSFRADDVTAGKYTLRVYLEKWDFDRGKPELTASYSGTVEVPEIPDGRSDEPLDLGKLELTINKPLQADDKTPLSKAKASESKNRTNPIQSSTKETQAQGQSEDVNSKPAHRVITITRENLYEVARALNYKVGPEWFSVAESQHNRIYESLERYAERSGETRFNEVLDDWVRWKYDLDTVTDTDSAMELFETFCDKFDSAKEFFTYDPKARAIKLICDKLDTDELIDRYIAALHSGKSFCSGWSANYAYSINERIYTDHEKADVLPASLSAVWHALLRIDEMLDKRYPASCNVIEEKLTPILIEDYVKRERLFVLDNAVLLGGPAIAEFLLQKDWRDKELYYNIENVGSPSWPVNMWLLRLINLNDPAGEKFRAEHPDVVLKFADMWAESIKVSSEFNPPRFLIFDRQKGRDSFAWQYWPAFSARTDQGPFSLLVSKFSYLNMLEPFTTTQIYFECWVRALNELDKKYLNPRGPLEHLPAHRKHKLAEMVLKEVNERLKKTDLGTEENSNRWSRLVYHRDILSGFLNK